MKLFLLFSSILVAKTLATHLAPFCLEKWKMSAVSGVCIRVLGGPKHRMKFVDAGAHCGSLGANLVTAITRKAELVEIKGWIPRTKHFWIGLRDLDKNGVYSWVDSAPMQANTFFKNGKTPRPGRCVSINRGKWRGKRCSKKQNFICQMDAEIPAVTTEHPGYDSTTMSTRFF